MEGDGMEWNGGEGARDPLFVLFRSGWNEVVQIPSDTTPFLQFCSPPIWEEWNGAKRCRAIKTTKLLI